MARIADRRPRPPALWITAALTLAVAGWIALSPAKAEIFGRLTRGPTDACRIAIDRIERAANIPAQLMTAISMVESGRSDPETGEKIAWPWTVNNAGDGRYFASKAQAMAHVRTLWGRGERNIDVGCMQINLMYHPEAFIDLEEAFDPAANVAYAASYLRQLRDDKHSWSIAVAHYHSATPERGQVYRKKVFDAWTNARLDYDRQQRAAVVAEYKALRAGRQAKAQAQAQEQAEALSQARPAATAKGVTVLRPRENQERLAWSAGVGVNSQQRVLSTNSTPRKLNWYRSATGGPTGAPTGASLAGNAPPKVD
jgi:hypothetical protein